RRAHDRHRQWHHRRRKRDSYWQNAGQCAAPERRWQRRVAMALQDTTTPPMPVKWRQRPLTGWEDFLFTTTQNKIELVLSQIRQTATSDYRAIIPAGCTDARNNKGASTSKAPLARCLSEGARARAIGTGMPIPERISSTTGQPASCADLWI